MTDDELLAAIDAAESMAIGSLRGEVASDREDAIRRYLGQPYGNERPGRSSIVSRDVADVVEGVLANVIKPFVAGEQVVQFSPRGPEDENAAQQETDYVNFVALERNNGFVVLTSSFKDALLLRNGYIKCGWTTRSDVTLEFYAGQSDDQLAMLLQDPDIEVVNHSEYPDPSFMPPPMGMGQPPIGQPGMMGQPPMPQAPMLHDVKIRRKGSTEYVEITAVPPDEIVVSERTRMPSVQDTDFVQHRTHKSLSELRQAGYDVPDGIADDDDGQTLEDMSRQRFGVMGDTYDDHTADPARRLVLFKETWIRIDRDGDGIAELRRVCSVGHHLLADEEADVVPIAAFTGTLMSHQHLGLSIYDMVKDLAEAKTALFRQFMDNKYLSNNGRMIANPDTVNIDDLLESRPGGVIRTTGDPATSVIPVITPDTGPSALAGLEYLDSVRENRTGYTRYAQGMDSDSLVNKTATGLMQATNQSQMRLEMVSRTIAETGIRDLFRIIHALTLKHATKAEKIRLRNKWTVVNPREWVRRTDLQISVGLGAGSTDQIFAKLQALAPLFQQAQGVGLAGPQEFYNYGAEILKSAGFKNPDKFIHPPETDPQTGKPKMPQPSPPPEVLAAQAMAQGQVQAKQIDAQAGAQRSQLEAQTELQKASLAEETKRYGILVTAAVDLLKSRRETAVDYAKIDASQHEANLAPFMSAIDHMAKTIRAPNG